MLFIATLEALLQPESNANRVFPQALKPRPFKTALFQNRALQNCFMVPVFPKLSSGVLIPRSGFLTRHEDCKAVQKRE